MIGYSDFISREWFFITWGRTHTRIHPHRSDFKKPDVHRPAPGLKTFSFTIRYISWEFQQRWDLLHQECCSNLINDIRVEGPTETLPLPTVPDELTVGASGENLGLIVVCPLNWLNTGGVVYNVVKFELCGLFGFVGAGTSLVHMAIGGDLTKERLVGVVNVVVQLLNAIGPLDCWD